jgi:hypothetical protein
LHAAEFLDPALRHRELVAVDHDVRLVLDEYARQRLPFRRAQQQMVAVEVGHVLRAPGKVKRSVRIRARDDQHVDPVEQAGKLAACKLARERQACLPSRRLVAVQLTDDQHGRLAVLRQRTARRRSGPRQHEQRERPAFGRVREHAHPQIGGFFRSRIDEREQLLLAGEILLARRERGCRDFDGGIGKLGRDRRRLAIHLGGIEARHRLGLERDERNQRAGGRRCLAR